MVQQLNNEMTDQQLLQSQEEFVRMVLDGRMDKAMQQFNSKNRVNVGVSVFNLGRIRGDEDLMSKAYSNLQNQCIAIGFKKDLGALCQNDPSVWWGPLDQFLGIEQC